MSSEETKLLAEIINGILNPDNTVRNKAVEKLESLRQNTSVLIYHLFKIIQGTIKFDLFPFINSHEFPIPQAKHFWSLKINNLFALITLAFNDIFS